MGHVAISRASEPYEFLLDSLKIDLEAELEERTVCLQRHLTFFNREKLVDSHWEARWLRHVFDLSIVERVENALDFSERVRRAFDLVLLLVVTVRP